jgi:ketosteroid isomerase-like protein
MPWFPDFASAVELARQQTRTAGQADPVGEYFTALNSGDADELETVWPGEVVVYDPKAGEIRGHRHLRHFVAENQTWLAQRGAHIETVASTTSGGRAVVELLAHLADKDGADVAWPIAVVAESADDRSVVFRTYCSQWPVDGRRHLRPAILEPATGAPGGVIERYRVALGAGDVAALVETFAPDGYVREPIGPDNLHRGADELSAFFTQAFSTGGGISLQPCATTDEGTRTAVEYNCVRWGAGDMSPQAGIAVFERSTDNRLAAVRIYDDVQPPV